MRSFVWWMAYRQVFSRQTKAGLLFMTLASMLGITIGISALVVTLSVMGGFERELREKIFFGLPHLEIMNKKAAAGISMKDHPLADFAQELSGLAEIGVYIKSDVIAKNLDQYASVTVLGLDPRKSHDIWGIKRSLEGDKSFESMLISHHGEVAPAVVGVDLAANFDLFVGQRFSIISPHSNISGFLAGERLSHEYVVAGIFRTGREDLDGSYVVTNLGSARQFMHDYEPSLDVGEYVSGIAATFHDPNDVDAIGNDQALLSQFSHLSWKQVNKSLLIALMLEKIAMSVVLFLIVLVAVFSLSGTVMMTVYHKKTQIALLRGLGMSWQDISKVFMAHGSIIGVVGISFGLFMGLMVCLFIQKVGVVDLPQGLYSLQKLPVKFLFKEYILISLGAFLLTVMASVYPAYIAGRQDPGEGLRY